MQPLDSVTRFIFSQTHFSRQKQAVKERAFRPSETARDISVFRITGKTEDEVWAVGRESVLPERKTANAEAKIHARADFNSVAATDINLSFELDEPPPEHFILVNWPPEKDARIQLAQILASRAFLKEPASPIG